MGIPNAKNWISSNIENKSCNCSQNSWLFPHTWCLSWQLWTDYCCCHLSAFPRAMEAWPDYYGQLHLWCIWETLAPTQALYSILELSYVHLWCIWETLAPTQALYSILELSYVGLWCIWETLAPYIQYCSYPIWNWGLNACLLSLFTSI